MCRTVEIAQYINSLSSEDDSFDFGSATDESDQYNCSNSMFSTVTQTVLLAAIAVKMIRTCNLLKKYERVLMMKVFIVMTAVLVMIKL